MGENFTKKWDETIIAGLASHGIKSWPTPED
jgi:hypothetical protein